MADTAFTPALAAPSGSLPLNTTAAFAGAIPITGQSPRASCKLIPIPAEGVPHCHDPNPMGPGSSTRFRMKMLVLPVLCLFAVLAARLVWIHVGQNEKWSEAAQAQAYAMEKQPAPRGEIRGSTGEVLARSVPRQTIVADLKHVKDKEKAAAELSAILKKPESEIDATLSKENRRIVYVAKRVEPDVAEQIKEKKIAGISLEPDYVRSYLWGKAGCHWLGFSNTDGGVDGTELELDSLLKGIPGYFTYERDARRQPISRGDNASYMPDEKPPRQGLNVTLTMHPGIQTLVEQEMDRMMADYKPLAVSAIVMDVRNGSIVAMACRPGFDPNEPGDADSKQRRNRAICDTYEPGSTFKTFVASMALEDGICNRTERFNCENGAWHLSWRTLHDAHAYGVLSFEDVLVFSSNIGAAKIGSKLGEDELYRTVRAFGFGEPTHLDMPGEAKGIVRPKVKWSKDSVLSVSMGQEISVTPIQLVTAYSAMLNGGVLFRPQVVQRISSDKGEVLYQMQAKPIRRVISPQTSRTMREILEQVVVRGTARTAFCKEYAIGGKTGTAQKVIGGHYSHDHYVGSFCGFAPADNPRFVCLVAVDEPDKSLGYYGGTVAAPSVKEILRRSLKEFDVPERSPEAQAKAQDEFNRRKNEH